MMSTTSATNKHKVAIHWYRNGLRFHDNPCLLAACDESETLLPLYVIDPDAPFAQTANRRAGCIRANFLLTSMQEIDNKLRLQNSQLVVILGKPEQVIPQVIVKLQASALYYEKEPAAPVRQADCNVLSAISQDCEIRGFHTHTLHPMENYLAMSKHQVAPSNFGGFAKLFARLKVPLPKADVKEVPPLPPTLEQLKEGFGNIEVPTLQGLGYTNIQESLQNRTKGGIDFDGGEDAALALLELMMKRTEWVATFEKPKTSPNALTVDTTGLSPYVKHGCLSPRLFYHELAKVYAKVNPKTLSKPPVSLHGQLMWREFNYLMGYSTPNFDKMVGNPVARQIPWDDDPGLVEKWRNAQTGYPYIDAIMTQLRQTGFIHHLARHSVACFLTRGDLWQSWEEGAKVFEELLIDADWSINNFNWQWLSCTAHFYQYFRCYSPVAFGKKTDKNGDYIRKWLPMFKSMPAAFIYEPWDAPIEVQRKCGVIVGENYPYPIVDHKTISKSNMTRMKEAYDAQKNGLPMPAPPNRRNDSNDDNSIGGEQGGGDVAEEEEEPRNNRSRNSLPRKRRRT